MTTGMNSLVVLEKAVSPVKSGNIEPKPSDLMRNTNGRSKTSSFEVSTTVMAGTNG